MCPCPDDQVQDLLGCCPRLASEVTMAGQSRFAQGMPTPMTPRPNVAQAAAVTVDIHTLRQLLWGKGKQGRKWSGFTTSEEK